MPLSRKYGFIKRDKKRRYIAYVLIVFSFIFVNIWAYQRDIAVSNFLYEVNAGFEGQKIEIINKHRASL